MGLRRRERLMLALTEQAIGEADARLAGMFAVFNSLATGEGLPTAERVSRRARVQPRAEERAVALVIAALVAMLAGSAVITPGGPACGRGTAGTAAVARGCLIPGADHGLFRGLPVAGRAEPAVSADRPGHR